MAYQVVITRTAERELRALSAEMASRIGQRLRLLVDDPHPAQSIRLRNSQNFRLRVGDHRIIYSVDESAQLITILAIGHRREVYRDQ